MACLKTSTVSAQPGTRSAKVYEPSPSSTPLCVLLDGNR